VQREGKEGGKRRKGNEKKRWEGPVREGEVKGYRGKGKWEGMEWARDGREER